MSDQIDKQTNLTTHNQAHPPTLHSGYSVDPPSLPIVRPFMAEERPCSRCGYANHIHEPECYACGSQLQKKSKQVRCSYCHTHASNQLVLCPGCGRELLAAPSALSTFSMPLLLTLVGIVFLISVWQLGNPVAWTSHLLQNGVSYISRISRESAPILPTGSVGITPVREIEDIAMLPIDSQLETILPALAVGPTDLEQISDSDYEGPAVVNNENIISDGAINLQSPTPMSVAIVMDSSPTPTPEVVETATLEPIVINFGLNDPPTDTPQPDSQPDPQLANSLLPNTPLPVAPSNLGAQDPTQPVNQLNQLPQPAEPTVYFAEPTPLPVPQQNFQQDTQPNNPAVLNSGQSLGTGGAVPPEPEFPTPILPTPVVPTSIPPTSIPPTPVQPAFIPPTLVPPAYNNPPSDPNTANALAIEPTPLPPPINVPIEIPTATPYPTLTSEPTLTPYPTPTPPPIPTIAIPTIAIPTIVPTWTPLVQPTQIVPTLVPTAYVPPTVQVPTELPNPEPTPLPIPTLQPSTQPSPMPVIVDGQPDEEDEIRIGAASRNVIELYMPANDTIITNCQSGPILSWKTLSPLNPSHKYIVQLGFISGANGEVSWVIEKMMGADQTSWQVDSSFCGLSRSEYGHQWRWNVKAVYNENEPDSLVLPLSSTWRFIWN